MFKNKNGILGSILFHIILVIMFIFLGFSTPLPLPGEEGILINFGDSDMGRGKAEPKKNVEKSVQQKQIEQQPAIKTRAIEQNLTQDIEEAPSLPTKKETPKIKKPQR